MTQDEIDKAKKRIESVLNEAIRRLPPIKYADLNKVIFFLSSDQVKKLDDSPIITDENHNITTISLVNTFLFALTGEVLSFAIDDNGNLLSANWMPDVEFEN
jgi:hypothetical protein